MLLGLGILGLRQQVPGLGDLGFRGLGFIGCIRFIGFTAFI